MLKSKFYRECYLQTGWIPMQPLVRPIELGDVCQIHHGYFQPLMNITQISLVEPISFSLPIALNPIDWRVNSGVQQTFCSTDKFTTQRGVEEAQYAIEEVEEAEQEDFVKESYWTKQILSFSEQGSFIFHGDVPECRLMLNWNNLRQDAILKLTQTHYTFRDIYVVTGVATLNDWGLAIAGNPGAQLDMSAETQNTDLFNLISHKTAKTEQCKQISTYEKSHCEPAYFFKAKKLVFSDEMHDRYLNRLLDNNRDLTNRAIANWFNSNLINQVKANELNLATTMEFFTWVDATLDDVERLLT